MLKIGIIGLGNIAHKAYLPVISGKKIDVHLFTRKEDKLSHFGELYRFANRHSSLESMINSGVQGAFIHTATESHAEIAEQLLLHNIHVYVDKPIAYDYTSTEKLTNLAKERNLILMTGFNRRYAPSYQELKNKQDVNMIIMQKNRKSLPREIRSFIYDDFIHVIDTLLYLFPYPIHTLLVNGRKKDGLLFHVVVQFLASNGATALGIMNRDSGTVTEKLEVITPEATHIVSDLAESMVHQNKNRIKHSIDDWESTLHKRGFEQIIQDFLQAVESGKQPMITKEEALLTHKICEEVVEKLSIE